jgi:hypothetical protein
MMVEKDGPGKMPVVAGDGRAKRSIKKAIRFWGEWPLGYAIY